MSPDEIQREFPTLPRLVAAWQAGDPSLQDQGFAELNTLLRSDRSARSYFLEAMQIDAELRWRMASTHEVDCALASDAEGTPRPIASILLSELSFRNDEAFADVYQCVGQSEEHAQLWLRLYPAIRACVLLCHPSLCSADAEANAICSSLVHQRLASMSLDEFRRLVGKTTVAQVSQSLRHLGNKQAKSYCSIVELCLETAVELDTSEIYESVEAIVPHQLPTDSLRLLCMRYLIEQTPAQMASRLAVSSHRAVSLLAEARNLVWRACTGASSQPVVSPHDKTLTSLNCFFDGGPAQAALSQEATPGVFGAKSLDSLLTWLTSGTQNCRCLLTFALIHEALYRQLSLPQLLNESQTRKDEEFHAVVTDMVSQLEDVPATSPPKLATRSKPVTSRAAVGWLAAIAAALLVAATSALWLLPKSKQGGVNHTTVTEETPIHVETPQPAAEPIAPPQPVVVGTVMTALNLPDGHPLNGIGGLVFAGQTVELTEGIVQISTVSGSQWVLEGPISVTLSEDSSVTLQHGRLVGLNSGQQIPLVVHTPNAKVVDVGTEFGVGVDEDLTTFVAVYQGEVQLAPTSAGNEQVAAEVVAVEANTQVVLPSNPRQAITPQSLVHDRGFIRPDEVQLRVEEEQGSLLAAEKVAFYEMLRTQGLLAYQSFHGDSQGKEFTFGFAEPYIRPSGIGKFGTDLAVGSTAFASSQSLVLANKDSVFLDLDVSDRSPLARSELVDDTGQLGNKPGEIWLFWRSQSTLQANQRFQWVGLSMMRGDERGVDEPLFIGQPSGLSTFGIQSYGGDEVQHELDIAPQIPGVQPLNSDSRPHHWVTRIDCKGEGHVTVSVWCDVDPSRVESVAPQTEQAYENFSFDRLRLEVSQAGDRGQCAFDQVVLGTSADAINSVLSLAAKHPQGSVHEVD